MTLLARLAPVGWHAAVIAALLCAGCNSTTPRTQVMVLIDSEDSLRASIASVELEVRSGAGNESSWSSRLQRSVMPGHGKVDWPIELALVPRAGDEAHGYSVTASAKDVQGQLLGQTRAVSGYVHGQTLALLLKFDGACFARAQACDSGFTCKAGECVDSHVAVTLLPPYERTKDGHPVVPSDSDAGADAATTDASTAADGGGELGHAGHDGNDGNDGIDAAILQSCGSVLCDPLAPCLPDQGGCGQCPSGFVGSAADGCIPTLIGLDISGGKLDPELSASVTRYTVHVPLLSSVLTLTPRVPADARVEINGSEVAAGASFTTASLPLGNSTLSISVSYAGHESHNYRITIEHTGNQTEFIKAPNSDTQDGFGQVLALSHDRLVIGSPYEDSKATGVDGNQGDNSVHDCGAVYVMERGADRSWQNSAYLKADKAEADALFGSSVAIDGDTIAIGEQHASSRGAAYVFTRDASGSWQKQALLTPNTSSVEAAFGASIALQGDTLLVGAPFDDSAALDQGAVYVFTRSAGLWTQRARLVSPTPGPSDWFGTSVGISGANLVIGAPGESVQELFAGGVHVFSGTDGQYTHVSHLLSSIEQPGDSLGQSVAIDGETIVAGLFGHDSGHGLAYVYVKSGEDWARQATLTPASAAQDDSFGLSVAIAGDIVAIARSGDDSGGSGVRDSSDDDVQVTDSGEVVLYARSGASGTSGAKWSAYAYVKPTHPGDSEFFGTWLALDHEQLIVGDNAERSDVTGIDGDETRGGAEGSGAVYVFH